MQMPENPTLDQVKQVAIAVIQTQFNPGRVASMPELTTDGKGWQGVFTDSEGESFNVRYSGGNLAYSPFRKAEFSEIAIGAETTPNPSQGLKPVIVLT